MSKTAGGRKSAPRAFTAGKARIPGMGAISIFASLFLPRFIGRERRSFNLSALILSHFRARVPHPKSVIPVGGMP
jgi:hypothetical protein